ncbi:hypothetical protein POM88_013023 [Heracleum sosnowskyi]|uniref:RNase H type-1 domain-containing protein n=1 Tax=Heracleum sosnowskyi TaxID=360622 RepID=A0AAD8IXM4_9APIA|nr:hypothetical protein POM88_013023 [Heracleum sosnowskyi]
MVRWSRPHGIKLKVNVKGMFTREIYGCGLAVIIRDSEGHWVHGCCKVIGGSAPYALEMHALLLALNLAWNKGKNDIVIECEHAKALHVINDTGKDDLYDGLVKRINKLRDKDWEECEIVLIDPSANAAVVALADHAHIECSGSCLVKELRSPPSVIQSIIDAESRRN